MQFCAATTSTKGTLFHILYLSFLVKNLSANIFSLSLSLIFMFLNARWLCTCVCEFAIFLQHNNICMHAAKNTQLWLDFCFYSLSIACHFRYISLLDNSHSFGTFIFRQLFLEFRRLNFLFLLLCWMICEVRKMKMFVNSLGVFKNC